MNQILSITCDNASNNDAMIRHLGGLIDEFKGRESQTRCFAHILNLIAKSILRQFDVPRAQVNVFDDATTALIELAGNIELEEQETIEQGDDDDKDDDEVEDENVEDWVDERKAMNEEQLAELDESVQPVRLMLVKVRVKFQTQLCAVVPFMTHSHIVLSYAKLHLPSRTHQLLSFLIGLMSSTNWVLMLA